MATKQRELGVGEIAKWIKAILPYYDMPRAFEHTSALASYIVENSCGDVFSSVNADNFIILTERFPVRQSVFSPKQSSKLFSFFKSVIEEDFDTVYWKGHYFLASDNTLVGKDSLFLIFCAFETYKDFNYNFLLNDVFPLWFSNVRHAPSIITGGLGNVKLYNPGENDYNVGHVRMAAIQLSTHKPE